MEALTEHSLEPEVTLPAPRPLRLPLRAILLLGVAVLLLGVFVLGSSRAVWEGIKLIWLAQTGHTVSGKIVEIRTEAGAAKGQAPRQVAVRYRGVIPGPQGMLSRSGWIALGQAAVPPNVGSQASSPLPVPRFHVGQAVPLRYASALGMTESQPWGPRPGGRILALLLLGGVVLVVSLLMLRRLLRGAQSQWHLLRHGTAAVGTVTHKRSESEDMVRYFVRYGYPVSASEGREHEEQVSVEQWRVFQVGQPVTVLFDPDKSSEAGLYALMRQ